MWDISQRNQGKKTKKFRYTYQDIADIMGLAQGTVRKYAQTGKYDPDSLKSVIEFVRGRYKDG